MGRGFAWADPVERGSAINACSMAHLDYIHDHRGDMTELNQREQQAVYDAVKPILSDIREFPWETAPDEDVYEFAAYLYQQVCDKAIPY